MDEELYRERVNFRIYFIFLKMQLSWALCMKIHVVLFMFIYCFYL